MVDNFDANHLLLKKVVRGSGWFIRQPLRDAIFQLLNDNFDLQAGLHKAALTNQDALVANLRKQLAERGEEQKRTVKNNMALTSDLTSVKDKLHTTLVQLKQVMYERDRLLDNFNRMQDDAQRIKQQLQTVCKQLEASKNERDTVVNHLQNVAKENDMLHANITELDSRIKACEELVQQINSDRNAWEQEANENYAEYSEALNELALENERSKKLKAELLTLKQHLDTVLQEDNL